MKPNHMNILWNSEKNHPKTSSANLFTYVFNTSETHHVIFIQFSKMYLQAINQVKNKSNALNITIWIFDADSEIAKLWAGGMKFSN